jgi:hypothetical protein
VTQASLWLTGLWGEYQAFKDSPRVDGWLTHARRGRGQARYKSGVRDQAPSPWDIAGDPLKSTVLPARPGNDDVQ